MTKKQTKKAPKGKAKKVAAKGAKGRKGPTVKLPPETPVPTPAKPQRGRPARERDPRLPPVGTLLARPYKGKVLEVTFTETGFRYEGRDYRSLSALAAEITGAGAINGFAFFKLTDRSAAKAKGATAPTPAQEPAAATA